jgi:hypothetical protein
MSKISFNCCGTGQWYPSSKIVSRSLTANKSNAAFWAITPEYVSKITNTEMPEMLDIDNFNALSPPVLIDRISQNTDFWI